MIKSVTLTNYGPIGSLNWNNLGRVNLIIGPNRSGKTFLLKSIYSALKTTEQFKRGKENRTEKEILTEKLYWTFQTQPIGNLVKKGAGNLSFSMETKDGNRFYYSFGSGTAKSISTLESTINRRNINSIFIPAKEVLSLQDIILDSRNRYSEFGFEDPYFDLAKAIAPTGRGRNLKAFSEARQSMIELLGGKLEFDEGRKEWRFKDGRNREYEISLTSEGVKKLSIIELLLGNHYLSRDSVIIIDEVEANLHPSLISRFMEIIFELSKDGVQFFISTHSYFVIKKLYILAHKNKLSVPVVSFDCGSSVVGDLQKQMPKNAIIDESISLYKEEIGL
ncbi:MAG: AAA family ATPase [Bacteroidales bacterium]|nr:AAA family ATPase [Bacteroidales bacterium]